MVDIEEQQSISKYADVREACSLLQVSRATLNNYCKHGHLRKFESRAPIRVLFLRSELETLRRVRPRQ